MTIKKLIISLSIVTAALIQAPVLHAEETTCTQSYGQPVVCGTKTPEDHIPIQAGLADINLNILGSSLISMSGVFLAVSTLKRD